MKEIFNTLDVAKLALKLTNAGFTSKTAAKIAEVIDKERKKKIFASLNDVVERVKIKTAKRVIKAISTEKMLNLVDIWLQT